MRQHITQKDRVAARPFLLSSVIPDWRRQIIDGRVEARPALMNQIKDQSSKNGIFFRAASDG